MRLVKAVHLVQERADDRELDLPCPPLVRGVVEYMEGLVQEMGDGERRVAADQDREPRERKCDHREERGPEGKEQEQRIRRECRRVVVIDVLNRIFAANRVDAIIEADRRQFVVRAVGVTQLAQPLDAVDMQQVAVKEKLTETEDEVARQHRQQDGREARRHLLLPRPGKREADEREEHHQMRHDERPEQRGGHGGIMGAILE